MFNTIVGEGEQIPILNIAGAALTDDENIAETQRSEVQSNSLRPR